MSWPDVRESSSLPSGKAAGESVKPAEPVHKALLCLDELYSLIDSVPHGVMVVDAFFSIEDEILEIKDRHQDSRPSYLHQVFGSGL